MTAAALSRRRLLQAGAVALTAPLAAPAVVRADAARTLRYVPPTDLAILDPVWTTAAITTAHALMVFDTLYGLDEAYRAQPQMVDGHAVEDDGRRWTLTLREGLRFHDGEPVLGRDAVASIRRWAARDMFGQALLAVADEISAPDDRTVRFRLKRPFPLLPQALGKVTPSICAIMPEHLARTDPGVPITEMVGSGPFRFLAAERLAGARTAYARFDGYVPRAFGVPSRTAGPKLAHFDRVEWQVIPDQATAAAALQAGEVDWLDTLSSDLLPVLQGAAGVTVGYTDDRSAAMLRFNSLYPPFDKPAVRRALLGAVDQKDFMTAAYGDDPRAWRVGTGFFLSGTPMASDADMGALTSPRDPKRVAAAIKVAGYGGEPVLLLAPQDYPALKALADVAADMLQRVGMRVDVQSSDWGTVVQRRGSRKPPGQGGWNLFATGTTTTLDPSGHLGLRGNGDSAWFGWPTSPRLESLRQDWLATPDLTGQQAICRHMQEQAFQDVPYLPLGESSRLTAYRTGLSGFPAGTVSFFGVQRG